MIKRYSIGLPDGRFQCLLCPNGCILSLGEIGKCQARQCSEEGVIASSYGCLVNVTAEPIEKKPIYHFKPGAKVLSIGSVGCSMNCVYCENHKISQPEQNQEHVHFSPSGVVKVAEERKCSGVCMTYNEPTISYEYLMDLSEKCHKSGLFLAIKTNGYVNTSPWSDICSAVDAINIDYKGPFNKIGAITGLQSDSILRILANISYAMRIVHTELSLPVFYNTELKDFNLLFDIIKDINIFTPIHLLRIFPSYRLLEDPVTDDDLIIMKKQVNEVFPFVYLQNVFSAEGILCRTTFCPKCKRPVLSRKSLITDSYLDDCCGEMKKHLII